MSCDKNKQGPWEIFLILPYHIVSSFTPHAQRDIKSAELFSFLPLLLGGKYQLGLWEQWIIHLAQDQRNCHLEIFHSAVLLQFRSLMIRRMNGGNCLCRSSHTRASGAWLSYCQLCFPPCLAHTQMSDLRMVSSGFSAHTWVSAWYILGVGSHI